MLYKKVKSAFELLVGKGLCTYYVRPLDGWVGYQGEYLGVHGWWVGLTNQYVHTETHANELVVAYKFKHFLSIFILADLKLTHI